MYIHLGQNTVVKTDSVIGIFDIESTTVSKHTRKFLTRAEKSGSVTNVSYELPKSFIVSCDENRKERIYISQISSSTLYKRSGFTENL